MKKLWGGRFKQSTDALMETFSASISFDKRLYACDIEGSIAHCKMLGHCKIITASESQKIQKGLKRILRECEEGRFEFS
ncbi:MAG: argininosuccinate lyase, partial [Nitrospinaceae bacterium]|nr:argininosuccinate lyase [Nitrospinaceae bacterium]